MAFRPTAPAALIRLQLLLTWPEESVCPKRSPRRKSTSRNRLPSICASEPTTCSTASGESVERFPELFPIAAGSLSSDHNEAHVMKRCWFVLCLLGLNGLPASQAA